MKTYTFTKSRGGGNEETYTVKESELKQKEKDLLLGILIRRYDDSPKEVQLKFKYMLCDVANDKNIKRFKNVIFPIVDNMLKDAIS